jgi:hypothetical protein
MLAAAARSRDRDRTRLFGTGRFKRRGGFILLLVCWDRAPAGVRQQGQYEEDGNRAGTPGQRGRTLGGKVPMYGGGPGSQGTLRRRSVGAMGAGLLSRRWRLECPGRAFTLPTRLLHAVRSTLQRPARAATSSGKVRPMQHGPYGCGPGKALIGPADGLEASGYLRHWDERT